uniref:Glucosamine-6-phosphate deaminase 1 n=1 Tax=Oreochromis niloticus TaxID=8128 RepID=A0A669C2F8_ORENI
MSLKSDKECFEPIFLDSEVVDKQRVHFSLFWLLQDHEVIILNDYDQASEWFSPGPNKYFTLGLPTGKSTPLGCYKKLIEYYKMELYHSRLPRDHPESYHSFMWNNFFKHIDIKQRTRTSSMARCRPAAECDAFEKKITAAGGIQLFVGGIGPDGHIAFNEPGSSLVSRTRVKTLAKDTIMANARFFDVGTVEDWKIVACSSYSINNMFLVAVCELVKSEKKCVDICSFSCYTIFEI